MLAMKTGWSRQEIRSLPAAEFDFYVETLIEVSKPKESDV